MIGSIEDTARALLSSAGAATLSQVWRVGVTFLTHMALRRMMAPEEFGPWYWIEPLFLVLSLVRDLGVPAHMVRHRDRPYGDFLRLQLTWGVGFVALVFAFAPYIARLYDDPSTPMTAMIRALAIFLLVQGLGAVPLIYFEAELKVMKTVPAELVRNAVFAILAITMAWQGFGIWSVIVAHVAGASIFTAMLWWAALPDLRSGTFVLQPGVVRLGGLVLICLPLMFMSAIEQAVLKLDPFILALRFKSEVVGFAGLAVFAIFFFSRMLADSIGRALYPALVRYAGNPERVFNAFRNATLLLASFSTPTCLFLFVNAEAAVLFLGGHDWLEAASYLRMLSLIPLLRPLSMFGFELLLTRHMDGLLMAYTTTNLIVLGSLGLWLTGLELLGPLGMALAGYFPLGIIFLAWGIRQFSVEGFKRLLMQLAGLYTVAVLCFLPVDHLVTDLWWRVAWSCLAGLLVLAYAAWRFGADMKSFLRG